MDTTMTLQWQDQTDGVSEVPRSAWQDDTHTHAYIEHKLIMWYETFNFNTPVPKEGQDILTMS